MSQLPLSRRWMGAAAIALLSGLTAPAFAQDKTKVVIGQLDWPGARAIEAVITQVMEQYLGAEVDTIAAAQEALYESLDRGDGTADIVADMWTDHLPAQMKNYVVPGSRESIILNTTPYLGTEGIYVPKFVADMGVTKVEDLARPEVAKMFDSDGNGKGEMWAGEVGWESTTHSQVRGKSYGFADLFEFTTVTEPVFLAQLQEAMTRQQPMVFYYYSPQWIFSKYELVQLQEPEFTGYTTEAAKGTDRYNEKGCYTFYQSGERNDWLEASDIRCGQPPTRAHIAHSKALAERAPKISQFLRQVTLDAQTINGWILATEVEGKDLQTVARDWVEQNKAMIENQWLKGLL